MSAIAADNTAHSHGRRALEQTLGNKTVRLGDARQAAGDGEYAIVNACDNLADTGAYARLVAQVSDVLACLANDDAGFLGRDDRAEGELRLGILLLSARSGIGCLAIYVQTLKLIGDRIGIASGVLRFFGGHFV